MPLVERTNRRWIFAEVMEALPKVGMTAYLAYGVSLMSASQGTALQRFA
jgi:hypothetical protein